MDIHMSFNPNKDQKVILSWNMTKSFHSQICFNIYYLQKFIQTWESAGAFGNVVNGVLCWFYHGKKNAVVKVFTYEVFLFRFYSVIGNS